MRGRQHEAFMSVLAMSESFFCLNASPVQATEFWAKNYIVMESLTHQVLEGKAIHEVQSVASISKIMTAIVAIEQADLDKVVTIGDEIDKAYGAVSTFIKGIPSACVICFMGPC